VHGHNNKKINNAIKDQLNKLDHSTLLGLANAPSIELAERLVEIAPKGLEKVFYSDSGSTSVEIAVKMAYQYWQNTGHKNKTDIVHLANSYHGDTLGSVSVGGIDLFHKVYRKIIFKTIQLDFPDCYRAPKGKIYPEYAFECLDKFESLLKKKGGTIAGFIVEPIVQGAAGMIMWPKGILKRMSQLCKKYNVIFIVDEVATGFGRTGKMFACEHENVSPDIMCVAKGLTGGYLPLAATLTTKRIFDGFVFDHSEQKTFFHGHTYTGNPICCSAAIANIDIFKKEKTLENMQVKIKLLSKGFERFMLLDSVGDIRQRGFMVGIELVKDKILKQPFDWSEKIGVRVCMEARKHGVILRPLGNVIVLMPPLSISKEELRMLLDVTYEAINIVTRSN
jgi:adenosylmethionine-8-amino-7-oxononanoate aminotransferase